jgi:predicted dehydrogenase
MTSSTNTAGSVRIALIGAGYWSIANHIPELAKRDDVELVSVCRLGRDELDVIRKQWNFPVATEDYNEALDAGVDAAIIASPNTLHYEHAMAALSRGLHVMVEKPLTPHADEAWAIVHESERRDVHLLVPYGWHYKPFVQQAKTLAARIGTIQHVLCHMTSPTPGLFDGEGGYGTVEIGGRTFEASPQTWADPVHAGGYAMGQLSHAVGLLCWLTGLRSNGVMARTRLSSTRVDLTDAAVVEFENGAIGTLSGCGLGPAHAKYQVDIRLFGTDGMMLLDIERERAQLIRHNADDETIDVVPGEGDYDCVGPPHRFIDLIRGLAVNNDSPGDVAARTAEIIEAVLQAAETRTYQAIGDGANT